MHEVQNIFHAAGGEDLIVDLEVAHVDVAAGRLHEAVAGEAPGGDLEPTKFVILRILGPNFVQI